jgi:hypothetical protein
MSAAFVRAMNWLASIRLTIGLLALPLLLSCAEVRPVEDSKVSSSGHRLIRVSFRDQRETFRLRVDQHPVKELKNADFTNVMTRLRLAYGDIVVWEDKRDAQGRELTHPQDISSWWFAYLHDVRASFYTMPWHTFPDFFAASIYHWKAPEAKPRPLDDAQFYVDGVAFGKGERGFQEMMDAAQKAKSGPIVFLAPRIKNEGQASPWIAVDQLSSWAQDAGVGSQFERILTSRFTEFLDFARFGDADD